MIESHHEAIARGLSSITRNHYFHDDIDHICQPNGDGRRAIGAPSVVALTALDTAGNGGRRCRPSASNSDKAHRRLDAGRTLSTRRAIVSV